MNRTTTIVVLNAIALMAIFSNPLAAEDRPEHFEGKPAETLEIAFDNLAEVNRLIAALVQDGAVIPEEHAELHQLTYTAENALAKIGEDLQSLKETLEQVHKASEDFDTPTVLDQTPAYLEKSQALFGR